MNSFDSCNMDNSNTCIMCSTLQLVITVLLVLTVQLVLTIQLVPTVQLVPTEQLVPTIQLAPTVWLVPTHQYNRICRPPISIQFQYLWSVPRKHYSELNPVTSRGTTSSTTLLDQVTISLTVETLRWQHKLLDLSACSWVNDCWYDCVCIQYSCQFWVWLMELKACPRAKTTVVRSPWAYGVTLLSHGV